MWFQETLGIEVAELELPDYMVTRSVGGDEIGQVHVADLIIDDLGSYGV